MWNVLCVVSSLKRVLFYFIVFLDHPIHPPKTNADPWDCEFLPDLKDIQIKMVNGVFEVFKTQADYEAKKPVPGYDYPKLDEYVTDMQLMCALIADGNFYFIKTYNLFIKPNTLIILKLQILNFYLRKLVFFFFQKAANYF